MSKVRRYFSIGEEEYTQMYMEQNGECSICGIIIDKHSADVDHSHIYNLIRGLLCRRCNLAIGMFEDNPEFLRRAADYIEIWEDIHKNEPLDD